MQAGHSNTASTSSACTKLYLYVSRILMPLSLHYHDTNLCIFHCCQMPTVRFATLQSCWILVKLMDGEMVSWGNQYRQTSNLIIILISFEQLVPFRTTGSLFSFTDPFISNFLTNSAMARRCSYYITMIPFHSLVTFNYSKLISL